MSEAAKKPDVEVVLKQEQPKQIKKSVSISHRNTPNRQVFVTGTPNCEFDVVDATKNEVVGSGKTTEEGKAIVLCSKINQFLILKIN